MYSYILFKIGRLNERGDLQQKSSQEIWMET